MTLGFSTKWGLEMGSGLAGTPTYFIGKIWKGLIKKGILDDLTEDDYFNEYLDKFDDYWDAFPILVPKYHTIRKGNRWKKGDKIHFVINNRTKNRFQFAPIVKCTGVQEIEIKYNNKCSDFPTVIIDGRAYNIYENGHFDILNRLAIYDGFESIGDFFEYFNGDFKGQIIHWADLRY